MARGRGKGVGRGSGKRFSAQSAEEIESRNARLEEFNAARGRRRADADDEDDKDANDDDKQGTEREAMEIGMRLKSMNVGTSLEAVTEDEDIEKKNKGLEGIISVENPNWAKPSATEGGMSRREREEAEKAAATAAYRRKHEMGLTEEYKRDMEKLVEVRKRREETEARNKAETEEEDALEAERKKQAEAAGAIRDEKSKKKSSKGSIPKLDKITIKKMKPTQLKEHLKQRGLEIQGNSKQLTQRLLEYEEKR